MITEPLRTHTLTEVTQTAFKVGDVVQADCNSDATYIFEGRAYPANCFAGKHVALVVLLSSLTAFQNFRC